MRFRNMKGESIIVFGHRGNVTATRVLVTAETLPRHVFWSPRKRYREHVFW